MKDYVSCADINVFMVTPSRCHTIARALFLSQYIIICKIKNGGLFTNARRFLSTCVFICNRIKKAKTEGKQCHAKTMKSKKFSTAGCRKRVAPEFSLFHFFHFSLYLDGTKWVCTARDVPGTKTFGRNGKMWKGENSGATRFQQSAVPPRILFFSLPFFSESFSWLIQIKEIRRTWRHLPPAPSRTMCQ